MVNIWCHNRMLRASPLVRNEITYWSIWKKAINKKKSQYFAYLMAEVECDINWVTLQRKIQGNNSNAADECLNWNQPPRQRRTLKTKGNILSQLHLKVKIFSILQLTEFDHIFYNSFTYFFNFDRFRYNFIPGSFLLVFHCFLGLPLIFFTCQQHFICMPFKRYPCLIHFTLHALSIRDILGSQYISITSLFIFLQHCLRSSYTPPNICRPTFFPPHF